MPARLARGGRFHLAETWHCPQPGNDDELRRGVAAWRISSAVSRPRTGRKGPSANRPEPAPPGPLRRGRGHAPAFPPRPALERLQGVGAGPPSLGEIYLSQKKYAEALATWREYLVRHTAHEGWKPAGIDHRHRVPRGQEKFATGDDAAAAKLLTDSWTAIRLTTATRTSSSFRADALSAEAVGSGYRRLAEAGREVPADEEASRAEFMIAGTLEEKLDRYDEAREHYRKVAGRKAAEAKAAVAAIGQAHGGDDRAGLCSRETPQLKLATRNVAAVKVRVYKIDLETYFRKMHSIAGIQHLDVSLIDPDATLEFAVPDYAKYKPLTSSIPVPLPDGLKAGVAAVTSAAPRWKPRPC